MRKNTARGFTLIELLIVIALLGALAVGLLATIDPFEQLKKGRDTAQRNTVSELYNAILRYYSIKGYFPWNDASTTNPTSGAVFTGFTSSLDNLVTAGELKDRFQDLAGTGNLARVYIYSPTSESAAVCFMPESKSFKSDANTIYDVSGQTTDPDYGANCRGLGGSSDTCYYCIQ